MGPALHCWSRPSPCRSTPARAAIPATMASRTPAPGRLEPRVKAEPAGPGDLQEPRGAPDGAAPAAARAAAAVAVGQGVAAPMAVALVAPAPAAVARAAVAARAAA